jgi:PAS domain S-box-containing protein
VSASGLRSRQWSGVTIAAILLGFNSLFALAIWLLFADGERGTLAFVLVPAALAACTIALSALPRSIRRPPAAASAGVEKPREAARRSPRQADRYGELVHMVNSIILCMDLEGRLTFFNECAENFFGYSREEVIGRSLFGTIVPEDDKIVERLLAQVRTSNRIPGPYGYNENENITSSGRRVWLAWSNKVITDGQGRAVEILSVGLDITRRKQMEDRLRNLNSTLHSLNADMLRDIQSAARIQKSILPASSPLVSAIHFDWLFEPSAELGGDIFNVFLLDEHNVGFYVLDVSGHGVTAALLSVTLNRLLHPFSDMSALLKKKISAPPGYELVGPALVAERLNEQFPLDDVVQQYFTLSYGIFNTRSLNLRYVSAGHPGLVYIPAGGEARLLRTPGFPIGFSAQPGYQEQSLQLNSGDRIYLYSDGPVEILDHRDRCFGTERLLACLSRTRSRALADTLSSVHRELVLWCNGRKAEDDITLLAAEIGNPEPL